MSKGRGQRLSSTTTTTTTTTSSPVQIPRQSTRTWTNRDKHGSHSRHPKHAHSPDAVPPSVAALLAMTDIPRHRSSSTHSPKTKLALTVQDIVHQQHVSEKTLSLSLTTVANPLEILLSPPDHHFAAVDQDDVSTTCGSPSDRSSLHHTSSSDSIPSLGDGSCATDSFSSPDSTSYFGPVHRSRCLRTRTRSPARKPMEPVRSPPDILNDEHPLSVRTGQDDDDDDDDDNNNNNNDQGFCNCVVVASPTTTEEPSLSVLAEPFRPLKAALRSNLTASLRALRLAAKSFSGIHSAADHHVLSRSLLAMDSKMPYTDERRPPLTSEMPSAELRRYLNPTTRPLETQQQSASKDGAVAQCPPARLASIQMQTYKVHRSRVTPPLSPNNKASSASVSAAATANNSGRGKNDGNGSAENSATTIGSAGQTRSASAAPLIPGVRQREMRENPDFIRIAVMEMAMRKSGKLDDRKPGRARWVLPPRKASNNTRSSSSSSWSSDQEMGSGASNGIPTRWIPLTCE